MRLNSATVFKINKAVITIWCYYFSKIGLLNLQYKSKFKFLIHPTTTHKNGQDQAMLLTFTDLES